MKLVIPIKHITFVRETTRTGYLKYILLGCLHDYVFTVHVIKPNSTKLQGTYAVDLPLCINLSADRLIYSFIFMSQAK